MNLSESFLNSLLSVIMVCCLFCGAASAETVPPEAMPRIAVFPMENLSGAPAPLNELDAELISVLKKAGLQTVDPATVENFINSHRVRYLGGVDEKIAGQLSAETSADTVLITSLEFYNEVDPPKISLVSRLVSLQGLPEIIWMDSIGIAGDDAPGILGLGLIHDIKDLRKKGFEAIVKSLRRYATDANAQKKRLSFKAKKQEETFRLEDLITSIRSEKRLLTAPPASQQGPFLAEEPYSVEDMLRNMQGKGIVLLSRYNPVGWYSSKDELEDKERTIAIIPFFNRSTRKHAAELQALHLAKQLVGKNVFKVLELGVIRDRMLNMHVIMTSGISLPNIDLVTIALGADLLLNGVVFDYLDTVGYGSNPKVDFSMQMFNREDKKILWSSHSHNQGDDEVFFFDYGRIATAAALADRMCSALVKKLIETAGPN